MNTKQLVFLMGLAISITLFPLDETPIVDEKTINTMLKEINSRMQEHKDRRDYLYFNNYRAEHSILPIHRIYCRILARKTLNDFDEYFYLDGLRIALEEMEKNTSTKEALHSAIDATIGKFTWSKKEWAQMREDNKKELRDFIETTKLATYSNLVSQKIEKCTVDSSTHNVFI